MMSLRTNNQFAKQRDIGKKLLLTVRTVNKNKLTWWRVTSLVPLRAANRLKKRSSIRTYPFHLAPHLCGDQEACQVNGVVSVGS